jgi:hypothetical protein
MFIYRCFVACIAPEVCYFMLNLCVKKQKWETEPFGPRPLEVLIGNKTHVCLFGQRLELSCNCAVSKV